MAHTHSWAWNDRDAFYRCQKCRVREALCRICGKRSGQPFEDKAPYTCSPACKQRYDNLSTEVHYL